MNEEEIADGARFGRDQELYSVIRAMARVVVRSLVGDRPNRDLLVEEISQATAVEIFQLEKVGGVTSERDRNKLICTRARNRCIDWLRRESRESPPSAQSLSQMSFDESRFPSFTESVAAMTRTPSSIIGWREIGAYAVDAIGRLPDGQREPVILYLFGGMKTTEIAATLGGRRTAVANRVNRGLLTLRDDLRRGFPDLGFDR